MKRITKQECKTCPRRRECQGRCARLPHRDRWGREMRSLRRTWEGRMLTQKILDIEDSLPPQLAEIAQLYYRQGLTQKQMAVQLGITQGSVSRALSRLHAFVHRRYHEHLSRLQKKIRRAIQRDSKQ